MTATQTLTATVQGLLDALPNLDVYTGVPPLTVRDGVPYVIYYPNPGSVLKSRLVAAQVEIRWECRIVVCGWNPLQVINSVEDCRDVLTDKRISPERSSSPLIEIDNSSTVLESAALTATDSPGVNLPRYTYTMQYRLFTRR